MATVRFRTTRTQHCTSRATFLGLVLKLAEEVAKIGRSRLAPEKIAELLDGTRYVRTKVKNLLGLGTSKRQAILTAIGSNGYWHLSRTLAIQTGMTNKWLRSQGLISIGDLWMKAHGDA